MCITANFYSHRTRVVRDYHKSYYRPDNLCLIITGKIDHGKLLKTLEPVEANILSKEAPSPMKRPWVESGPVPKLLKTVEETVLFPDEDESMGEIMISWNGPDCHVSSKQTIQTFSQVCVFIKCLQEYLELKAVDILNTYLTDSPVSVLQKEFVEIEDPLCTGTTHPHMYIPKLNTDFHFIRY